MNIIRVGGGMDGWLASTYLFDKIKFVRILFVILGNFIYILIINTWNSASMYYNINFSIKPFITKFLNICVF